MISGILLRRRSLPRPFIRAWKSRFSLPVSAGSSTDSRRAMPMLLRTSPRPPRTASGERSANPGTGKRTVMRRESRVCRSWPEGQRIPNISPLFTSNGIGPLAWSRSRCRIKSSTVKAVMLFCADATGQIGRSCSRSSTIPETGTGHEHLEICVRGLLSGARYPIRGSNSGFNIIFGCLHKNISILK